MPKYKYVAKKTSGERVEGVLEADNRTLVINRLQSMKYFPLSVVEEGGKGLHREVSLKAFERVGLRDVANFTRQMSDLLRSGLSLSRALGVLLEQTTNLKFREVIRSLRSEVSGGRSFAEALGDHPRIFTDLYTNMVHSGEVSGSLDAVMERLADFTENDLDTRNKIVSAMAYPAIMLLVGAGVVIVLLTFVIPRFTLMFEQMDQQLPAITQILVSISSFIKLYWWVMIGAVVLLGFLLKRYQATPEGRLQVDTFKLKIPLVSDFLRKREISKFARTMGTLLSNGVPILKALEIVESVMSNKVMANQIVNVRDNIREGERVSDRLGEGGVFPPMVVNMVAVGEETGSLEDALIRIARAYEGDTDRAMRTMTTMIEPLLILLMGGVVGFIVIAMILPIFQLSTSLR